MQEKTTLDWIAKIRWRLAGSVGASLVVEGRLTHDPFAPLGAATSARST